MSAAIDGARGQVVVDAPGFWWGAARAYRAGYPGFVLLAHETELLFPVAAEHAIEGAVELVFADGAGAFAVRGDAESLPADHPRARRFAEGTGAVVLRVAEVASADRPKTPLAAPIAAPTFTPTPTDGPSGRILSVNVSTPRTVPGVDGQPVETGIFKRPVEGRVAVGRLNLEGDGQADRWAHGGTFRAVYVYPKVHYAHWASELGRDLEVGQFGENFTVEGLDEAEVFIGDVFRVGSALLQVSQPRVPCFKLALKMQTPGFEKTFLQSGKTGFYLRVLEPGEVGAGDAMTLVSRDPNGVSVRSVQATLYLRPDDVDGARTALRVAALSPGWHGSFEERVAEADAAAGGFRPFRVARIEPESDTIRSFYLEPTDGRPAPRHAPGQFLTFAFDVPGRSAPLIRTYSLSDRPGAAQPRISVKREAEGTASRFLHDAVRVGDRLQVAAPRGEFVLDPAPDRDVVLLSAGVGITPLLSMLEHLVAEGASRRVFFLHGARNGREHAFGARVRSLAAAHPNVTARIAYSRPADGDTRGTDYDHEGRIDMGWLQEVLPFGNYEFYLVGPTPFMRDLVQGLEAWGVPRERIHFEFFGEAADLFAAPAPVEPPAAAGDDGALVTFARSGLQASLQPDESLLEAAERVGLTPAYSCRSGICQTCRCAVLEGEVEYPEPPLAPVDDGHALVCVARARGPVTVDL